jgi:thiamine-phosphate pyrophosphorylase
MAHAADGSRRRLEGLYAITPGGLNAVQLMELVDAAIAGGARAIQYRDKQADQQQRLARAQALLALCRGRQVPLIINDDLALCVQIGADGLHLGREDGDLAEARARLGAGAILGASCYASLALALESQAKGCSYIAFGRLFASVSKPDAPGAPLSLFQAARDAGVHIDLVGIGGITASNLQQLIDAGADAGASIQGVFDPPQRDAVFANARCLSHFFSCPT